MKPVGHAVESTFNGDSAFDKFGISVSGAGDVNGDGVADLVVGAYGDDNKGRDSGSARLLVSQQVNPGKAMVYGAPCAESRGYLPRIGVVGRAVISQTVTVTLNSAPASAAALLVIGPRVNIALGGGCTLVVFPVIVLGAKTTAAGRVRFPIPLANNPSLVGLKASVQWAIEDPVNKMLAASDGMALQVGSPYPK